MVKILIGFLSVTLSLAAQSSADFERSVRAAMAPSLDRQRISVQNQAATAQPAPPSSSTPTASAAFYTVPWPASPQFNAGFSAGPECDPMPKADLDQLVQSAATREGISAELVRLVIGKESSSRPCALSPKGAQGLMQLMPATADELGVRDPFDPKQNVDGGTKLLKRLLTKYSGDVPLALGAYNAGSGSVDRAGGIPPIPETVSYVSDIMSHFRIE